MRLVEAAGLSAVTFAVNLIWEVAQAPLYAGYVDFWQNLAMCVQASLGDVVIVGAIYVLFALAYRDVNWVGRLRLASLPAVAIVGALAGVAIEWWALATGRWQYAAMPILPLVNVGLLPLLQMTIIPPILFAAYAQYVRSRR